MSPWIRSPDDVLGKEDLNDLLGKYPDIERQHYKLWIAGTTVLESVFHNAILGRSDFAIQEIREKTYKYVQTKVHETAREKLSTFGVAIITGEAGVGKTTLAEQLCIEYVTHGFQLIVCSDSIEEAEAVFNIEKQQIFYFDDFLGRNYLSALERHEDTHITAFIKRISKDRKKRFVLTSRTNVLNQGKRLSDAFGLANIEKNELEVRISALSQFEKAKLLYNHIWFGELPIEYIEKILEGKNYYGIIKHKNFNPRLVSFITDPQRVSDIPPQNYWDYIQDKLGNPADVWEHTYEGQLDDYTRLIVLLVVFNGGKISEVELQSAYFRFIHGTMATGFSGKIDFQINLKSLCGSLLNRNLDGSIANLSLFNPSVADYVVNRVKTDVRLIESLVATIVTEHSIKNFGELISNSIIPSSLGTSSLLNIAVQQLRESKELSGSYKLTLAVTGLDILKNESTFLAALIDSLMDDPEEYISTQRYTQLGFVLRALIEHAAISADQLWNILQYIPLQELEIYQLEPFSPLCKFLPEAQIQQFSERVKQALIDNWNEYISEEIEEMDVIGDIYEYSDSAYAEDLIFNTVKSSLEQCGIPVTDSEITAIVEQCDIEGIIDNNIKRSMNGYEEGSDSYGHVSDSAGIDDLFHTDFPPM